MIKLPASERDSWVLFQLGTAATVVVYGIAHDPWLMSVSPDHFTEFHRTLIATDVPRLNTAALAFVATLGPGLLLGFLLWAVARWGEEMPRLEFRRVWSRLVVLLISIEAISATIGFLSARLFDDRGENGLLLPSWMFPELRRDLVVAQTIQISTYDTAAIGSVLLLWNIRSQRRNVAATSS